VSAGLLLLPKYEKHEGIKPEELLANAISPERYISTDKLAEKIINQDPSLLMIDVRDSIHFTKYSIPNSINVPLKNLLDDENRGFIDQDSYDILFISTDNFYADQAWIICDRLGFKNLQVLKNGINGWFKTIINPPVPTELMTAPEHDLYTFRKAASMYFGVAYPEQVKKKEPVKTAPKKVTPVRKKKKAPVEGGC